MCCGNSITLLLSLSIVGSLLVRAQNPVKIKSTPEGFLIVPVFINGSGPYQFVLDTGTNCTLIRQKLLPKLGIREGKDVPLKVINGMIGTREVSLDKVGVGSVGVAGLQAIALDGSLIEQYAGKAAGVLGEDFLRHFDILLDNRAKELTLDSEGALSSALRGEHVPLILHGAAGKQGTLDRPTIEVRLHRGSNGLRFLIDSGANHGVLVADDHLSFQGNYVSSGSLRTLNGKSHCRLALVKAEIGLQILPPMEIAACEGTARKESDVDGFLPTNLFQRIFLGHLEGYVIVNPQ